MKQHYEYKGYMGSIEADTKENFLYGRLLFIRDVVSYQGGSLASLEDAFEAAVDDYLATCIELGESPDVPCKGSFNVRIGSDLHQQVALDAAREDVTLNDWIKEACVYRLANPQKETSRKPDAHHVNRISAEFEDVSYALNGENADWQPQNQPQKIH